jgi:hypothetical protein
MEQRRDYHRQSFSLSLSVLLCLRYVVFFWRYRISTALHSVSSFCLIRKKKKERRGVVWAQVQATDEPDSARSGRRAKDSGRL